MLTRFFLHVVFAPISRDLSQTNEPSGSKVRHSMIEVLTPRIPRSTRFRLRESKAIFDVDVRKFPNVPRLRMRWFFTLRDEGTWKCIRHHTPTIDTQSL